MVVNKQKKSNKVCLNLGYSCSLALVLGFLQHCVTVVQTVRLSLYCTCVELPILLSLLYRCRVTYLIVTLLYRCRVTYLDPIHRQVYITLLYTGWQDGCLQIFLRDARTQEKNKMAHI